MRSQIKIPTLLAARLETDPSLQALVTAALSDFEPWLAHSNIPFFPDFTDHGPAHIAETLLAATALVSRESEYFLSAGDAAVLILATLLHDSAMHLTEEGVAALINGGYAAGGCKHFSEDAWPVAWERFIFDAARWSDSKVIEVFSSQVLKIEPSFKVPNLREPLGLTLRDRLLIGEFIRVHHARLAHEFAIFGVPGPGKNSLALREDVHPRLRYLVGLVARSHGMPLRDCVRILEKLDAARGYQGIHCVYLMTLLRVGDYLQIHAERAPHQVLKIKSIRSPLSLREWAAHSAIVDIGTVEQDPEAVFVHAHPEDVYVFLRVKDWLRGIQQELDQSWAVLGEMYGRYDGLRDLGLTIRRVRSNLDDEQEFSTSVDYVPELMRLGVSKGELLALLLEPLYGERPEVGIRELVQNAVDAVRERHAFERRRGFGPRFTGDAQPAVVVDMVTEDTEGRSVAPILTIVDSGIGMSVSTLRDYFLVIGASLRQSQQWQREFEIDGGALRSAILKSGRFGVGALAAFLLGPRVYLKTRHVLDKRGVKTDFSLENQAIELRFSEDAPVGTSITIPLTRASCDRLTSGVGRCFWDWYCLVEPRVELRINSKVLPQKWTIPGPESEVRDPWRSFVPDGFQRVDWSHESGPALACNGLLVKAEHAFAHRKIWSFGRLYIRFPNISVLDPDAKFPLNLERNGLTTAAFPFETELTFEVVRDFAKFLADASRGRRVDNVLEIARYKGLTEQQHPGSVFNDLLPFFATRHGVAPLDSRLLWELGPQRLLYVRERRIWKLVPKQLGQTVAVIGPVVAPVSGQHGRTAREDGRALLLAMGDTFRDCLKIRGARFLVTESMVGAIIGSFKNNMEGRRVWNARDWTLVEVGDCKETMFANLESLTALRDKGEYLLGAELFVERCAQVPEKSSISEIWADLGGCPLLSFDGR